jgi:ABC-type branched-subunit amino acid transport system ATPase component
MSSAPPRIKQRPLRPNGAPDYESGGREFESLRARRKPNKHRSKLIDDMSLLLDAQTARAFRKCLGSRRPQSTSIAVFTSFPRLGEKRTMLAGSLSGGEQQQVAIGRALMARPQLLLMDEPSVGLSPIGVQSMIDAIKMLHRERGLTILIVEQNVGVAAAVAKSAHILRDGDIVHSGDASSLINDTEVLSSYLGR